MFQTTNFGALPSTWSNKRGHHNTQADCQIGGVLLVARTLGASSESTRSWLLRAFTHGNHHRRRLFGKLQEAPSASICLLGDFLVLCAFLFTRCGVIITRKRDANGQLHHGNGCIFHVFLSLYHSVFWSLRAPRSDSPNAITKL
jgi:hypothetical protein